ncbi:hypothetical protein OEM_21760 [Mycobacterium intracellulare subsp. yongonense 05-1390]|nr:hypothetical protein OEM_21760 [Mycobacterium intracellulare subsp. yongonense 05-1390]
MARRGVDIDLDMRSGRVRFLAEGIQAKTAEKTRTMLDKNFGR